MKKFLNNNSFEYNSRYGTDFKADFCDFRTGVKVSGKLDSNSFADLAEMIGYHALFIRPELNGFQGYDCITFSFQD